MAEDSSMMQPDWYFLLIPPAWFAMLTASLQNHETIIIAGIILALVIPVYINVIYRKESFLWIRKQTYPIKLG